jgi:tRNA (guanine-N7-)-methyltransferase
VVVDVAIATQFKPEYKEKPVRSYVVRNGRITHNQQRAMENIWPNFRLSLFSGAPRSWQEIFHREAPVILEIGFGMGDSLLAMAKNEPDKDFIGVEVYVPGAGRLVRAAADNGMTNLKVYLADAVDVLQDCVPAQSLSRVQIYFPDPWQKRKHNKRRLVKTDLVEKIHRALIPGGTFHLATDCQAYAEQMIQEIGRIKGLENTAVHGLFCQRPNSRVETKFERRGLKLGHRVWDLVYRRPG